MKPFYQDGLVTIYNAECIGGEADVIVLDPPDPISIKAFQANDYIIFCGSFYHFYKKQLTNQVTYPIQWHFVFATTDLRSLVGEDLILITKEIPPGSIGIYDFDKRYIKWQRPTKLLIDLLKQTKGDILDPFMGSGTTLIAAKQLGRKCIGYDIMPQMCEIAAKRCSEL